MKFQQHSFAKVEDILAHPEDLPTFNGVDVQRRLYKSMGKGSSELEMVEDWTSIDLAGNSQDLRAVKLYYNEDSNELKRVMLHEDHMLVMPLPHEIAGKYPDMKLATLKDSIAKMKKQDAKAPTLPAPTQFQGDGNPFNATAVPIRRCTIGEGWVPLARQNKPRRDARNDERDGIATRARLRPYLRHGRARWLRPRVPSAREAEEPEFQQARPGLEEVGRRSGRIADTG